MNKAKINWEFVKEWTEGTKMRSSNGNVAILDVFGGDSGKGKIAHTFSTDFDFLIRFSGSSNCGHTIYTNNKKYVHHLIPSIDFANSNAKGFLGAGMVINPQELFDELFALEKDFPGVSKRMYVDPDAFIVLPEHIEEDKAKNKDLGTTNKGVGPAYASKVSRRGVKLSALLRDNSLITEALSRLGVNFKYVLSMKEELSKSKCLFEGSQGVLLDINHGTYPYVSSSDCTVSGIMSSGFGFMMPSKVYGLMKAYSTRVGTGPFPTELDGTDAEMLRKAGNEYGATTGRPRRVGWLDLAAIKYSIEKSGVTNLIITKLDILNGWEFVPVCLSYENPPVSGDDFFKAKPNFANIKGWNDSKDISQIRDFIDVVEKWTDTRVSFVSCGVNKSDIQAVIP